MALTSTMYAFDIALANVDRGVYESLEFRMAMHPSESAEYFVARLLAYCLEYTEGIAFSRGISDPDDPPLSVRDLTGSLKVWIELGAPDAARLHKASKAAPRVAVYTHRDPAQLWRQWEGEKIHRAEHDFRQRRRLDAERHGATLIGSGKLTSNASTGPVVIRDERFAFCDLLAR